MTTTRKEINYVLLALLEQRERELEAYREEVRKVNKSRAPLEIVEAAVYLFKAARKEVNIVRGQLNLPLLPTSGGSSVQIGIVIGLPQRQAAVCTQAASPPQEARKKSVAGRRADLTVSVSNEADSAAAHHPASLSSSPRRP